MTHPITPSRELAQQWTDQIYGGPGALVGSDDLCLAKLAAQWGADQELEACCEWFASDVVSEVIDVVSDLRAARRPQPPSLKKQALTALHSVAAGANDTCEQHQDLDTIRRALEQLDD